MEETPKEAVAAPQAPPPDPPRGETVTPIDWWQTPPDTRQPPSPPSKYRHGPAWPIARKAQEAGGPGVELCAALTAAAEGDDWALKGPSAGQGHTAAAVQALHELMTDPTATALAVYPTGWETGRALLEWRRDAKECQLRPDVVAALTGASSQQRIEAAVASARMVVIEARTLANLVKTSLTEDNAGRFLNRLKAVHIADADRKELAAGARAIRAVAEAGTKQRPNGPAISITIARAEDTATYIERLAGRQPTTIEADHNAGRTGSLTVQHVDAAEKEGKDPRGTPAREHTGQSSVPLFITTRGAEALDATAPAGDLKYIPGKETATGRAIAAAAANRTLTAVTTTPENLADVPLAGYTEIIFLDGDPGRRTLQQAASKLAPHADGVISVDAPRHWLRRYGENIDDYAKRPIYLGATPGEEGTPDRIPLVTRAGENRGSNTAKTIAQLTPYRAVTEAYPGAVTVVDGIKYRVTDWHRRRSAPSPFISVRPEEPGAKRTEPVIKQVALITSTGPEKGPIKAAKVKLTCSAEGYTTGGEVTQYEGQRANGCRLSRKSRSEAADGILIELTNTLWQGEETSAVWNRRATAQALAEATDYIRGQDPDTTRAAWQNIALQTPQGNQIIEHAVLLYNTDGATPPTTDQIREATRMLNPMAAEPHRAQDLTKEMAALATSITLTAGEEDTSTPERTRRWLVLAENTEVILRDQEGRETRATTGAPVWQDGIKYEVREQTAATTLAKEEDIEPVNGNWDWVAWQPATGETQELGRDSG